MSTEKITAALDASLLDVFQLCSQKYEYAHILNKKPLENAKALEKGSLIHVGKEAYYEELKESKDWAKAVDKGLMAARYYASSEIQSLEHSEVTWVLDTYEAECQYHKHIDLSYTIHKVESAFSYVLYEDDRFRFILIGKIDLLHSDQNHSNIPLDHKSFDRDFGVKHRGNQFVNYAIATNSNFVVVNRIGLQTSKKPSERFTRPILSYDEAYKEKWKQDTVLWFFSYIQAHQDGIWMKNNTSCDKWGRNCEYLDICETPDQKDKDYKLATFFKDTEPWDVSKVLSKKWGVER